MLSNPHLIVKSLVLQNSIGSSLQGVKVKQKGVLTGTAPDSGMRIRAVR